VKAITVTLSIVLPILGASILGIGLSVSQADSALARQQQQEHRLRGQVAALQAQLHGEHKDVLTCRDLFGMGLASYWVDGNYNLQSAPVSLPSHCINR